MPILLSDEELEALEGLPHLHRCLYIFGIRRYMDYQTGITGVKRKISYNSLSQDIYVEIRRGVKEISTKSRDQIKRILIVLEKAGLIKRRSVVTKDEKQLILECLLAQSDRSIQNKAAPWPPHSPAIKAATSEKQKNPVNIDISKHQEDKSRPESRHTENEKAATYPISDRSNLFYSDKDFDFLSTDEQNHLQQFQKLNLNINANNYLSAITTAKTLIKAGVSLQIAEDALKVKIKGYYDKYGGNAKTPTPSYFTQAILDYKRDLDAIEQQPQETTHERIRATQSVRQPDRRKAAYQRLAKWAETEDDGEENDTSLI